MHHGRIDLMEVKLSHVVYAILFAALLIAVGVIVYAANPRSTEDLTEFYVLGSGGKAENYPTKLVLGDSGTVILVIVNREHRDAQYSITVKLGNETIDRIEDIMLGNDESWEQNYTFTPWKVGNQTVLDFYLYINGAVSPYRELRLSITVTPTKNRTALSFDGVNDFIEISGSSSLVPNNMTIAFWAKAANPYVEAYQGFVCRNSRSNGLQIIKGWSDGRILFEGWVDGNSYSVRSNHVIQNDTWTYITVTASDDGVWKIYIDGQLDNQATGNVLPTTVMPLWMGRAAMGTTNPYFNGAIDEVKIYNRILTSAEVLQSYQGTYSDTTGLVLYLPFNGSTIDVSGHGNNGVNHGATWTTGHNPIT